MEKILVLGVGPGAPEYLTQKARELAQSCHVLIGGERNLSMFQEFALEKIPLTGSLETVIDYMKEHFGRKRIGVLVSGDPGLFSMLGVLRRHFPEEALDVVPGISALQYFFARLKLPWNDAVIVSLHGREEKELVPIIKGSSKAVIFTDKRWTPEAICSLLLEEGVTGKKVFVGEKLSYPDERILAGKLEDFQGKEIDSPNLMVILSESGES